LKGQVEELTNELNTIKLEQYELDNLRELLALDQQYSDYKKTGANVIGKDPGNWFSIFTIDKGSKDGIEVDMNVIAGNGLVGIVIDGLEAEKDVDIEDQGFLFKIRHKMTPAGKVSSIMYKFDVDGKTLVETINSNGGVRTFNESVQQHLGFTMDYFNIGFASSDISGFIEAPASERKKFVSKFIPSLTPYSNGYKVASKYLASLRKDIETLRNSLGEFDQIEHKKSKLSSVTNQIEHIKQEIADKQNIINGLKHSIVFILKQYNLKQPSELSVHLSAVEAKSSLLENEIFAQEATINCTDSLTILNTKVQELSTKISNTEIEQKYATT
jgi:DNA-binding transcriptional MerR regulator